MADYRMLYAATSSGSIHGELPVTSFTFSSSLNGAGSLSATIPLDTDTAVTLPSSVARPEITAANFATDGRTMVFVERDGAIVWGGIVWGYTADIEKGSAKISATGFLGYFNRRLITATATYAATEQTAIAWGLINTAQTASTIGVVDNSTATGTTRDRTYSADYSKPVGEALEDLTNLDGGFDMEIRSYWSSGSIVKSFETSFPQTGRSTGIVLDIASNLANVSVTNNGTAVNTLAWASGDTETATQSTANATLELSVPRLESIEAHPSVSETATLTAHSEQLSQRGSLPVVALTVAVASGRTPHVGSFKNGDIVAVRGSVGWLDIAGSYRIASYSVAVDSNGTESLSMGLASQGAF